MMALGKKLRYWWECAAGSDTLYSAVHSRPIRIEVGDEFTGAFAYGIAGKQDVWLKAEPVEGLRDTFIINENIFEHHHELGISGLRKVKIRPMQTEGDGRTRFQRGELAALFAQHAQRLEQQGFVVQPRQPFAAKMSLETPALE